MRVKCLVQEHNTMTRPGLEPGPLDPESSALTNRQHHPSEEERGLFQPDPLGKIALRSFFNHMKKADPQ